MKRLLAVMLLLPLFLCACAAGSVALDSVPETVAVEHMFCGQIEAFSLEGEERDAFYDWAASLRLVPKQFAEGSSPGDAEGGEVYAFTGLFAYYDSVLTDYVLMDGQWYEVLD